MIAAYKSLEQSKLDWIYKPDYCLDWVEKFVKK
jgi:hypothetical protein